MAVEGLIRSEEFETRQLAYGEYPVQMLTGRQGATLNVQRVLANPSEFHGDPNVHHLVLLGGTFEGLIGTYDGEKHGPWDPERLPEQGIVILEHHVDEARQLMDRIDAHAQRVVADKRLYDDQSFCTWYFEGVQDRS